VLALARKEADRFNHNYVGTEHLLLGLIKLGQGVAVNVLQKLGLDLETVRMEVEKQVGSGPDQKMVGNIPYTPRVKKVLALAGKHATGEELDRSAFTGGETSTAFGVLRKLDFFIERKDFIPSLISRFVAQADSETDLSTTLEGIHRPGHFDGVLTVVLKLLNIAAAERAYFGEKDWQQLRLVRGMADAFFLPTTIVACPTVRESTGLALSSRNARLTTPDRERAATLHRVLSSAATVEDAIDQLTDAGFAVDYVADRDGRRLAAVRLAGVRLIDNVPLSGAA